jgi:hypothetical protein
VLDQHVVRHEPADEQPEIEGVDRFWLGAEPDVELATTLVGEAIELLLGPAAVASTSAPWSAFGSKPIYAARVG